MSNSPSAKYFCFPERHIITLIKLEDQVLRTHSVCFSEIISIGRLSFWLNMVKCAALWCQRKLGRNRGYYSRLAACIKTLWIFLLLVLFVCRSHLHIHGASPEQDNDLQHCVIITCTMSWGTADMFLGRMMTTAPADWRRAFWYSS